MTVDTRERSVFEGQPIELYAWAHGSSSWDETSADADQVWSGTTYVRTEIKRDEIDLSGEDEQGSLEISVAADHPVAQLFVPGIPPQPVTLTIYRTHVGDSERIVFWSGEIASAELKGAAATLKGVPVSARLRRLVPGTTFQGQCNWPLFSGPCGLSKASFLVTAEISVVSADKASLQSSAFAELSSGYLRAGWLETEDGEIQWITRHEGSTIWLMSALRAIAPGDVIRAYPGCDRTLAACAAFDNLVHFCGFPFVPKRNPYQVGIG